MKKEMRVRRGRRRRGRKEEKRNLEKRIDKGVRGDKGAEGERRRDAARGLEVRWSEMTGGM